MKKKLLLCVIALASCFMVGCRGCYDDDPAPNLGMIIKYKQGAEFPEYFHARKEGIRNRYGKPEIYPHPLSNGYYISFGISYQEAWQYKDMVIMNFTMDDYNTGNVPEDWMDHWEEYALVENPLQEGWILPNYACRENHGVPYYCEECTTTNHVDTTCINRLIENGEIWNIAFCRYRDTTAVEGGQR